MIGLLVGVITFFLIGLFHPIVIKAEYYFGAKKPIIFFIIAGIVFIVIAILSKNNVVSIVSGVVACCWFWGIKELTEQEERVLKGWFPENPKRSEYYSGIRKVKEHKEY